MKNMIYDKDGNPCLAKTVFLITFISCMVKMFIQDTPDYSGLSLLIGSVGAIYYGRSHTKAQK